jgi:hypothetical protein
MPFFQLAKSSSVSPDFQQLQLHFIANERRAQTSPLFSTHRRPRKICNREASNSPVVVVVPETEKSETQSKSSLGTKCSWQKISMALQRNAARRACCFPAAAVANDYNSLLFTSTPRQLHTYKLNLILSGCLRCTFARRESQLYPNKKYKHTSTHTERANAGRFYGREQNH